jgi:hypothetical protein
MTTHETSDGVPTLAPSSPRRGRLPAAALSLVMLLAVAGCDRTKTSPGGTDAPSATTAGRMETTSTARESTTAVTGDADSVLPLPRARRPAVQRLVAIGDVHGDMDALRRVLRAAGLVDDEDRWSGGETVVVQTGDLLDRGDDEQEILDTLERLRREARAAGGALIVLDGNHEIMNVAGDLRYVTPGGFEDFAHFEEISEQDARFEELPARARPRMAAFSPGGPYARLLASHPIAVQVGETVFVHGGLLPQHAQMGLEEINEAARKWKLGELRAMPPVLRGRSSPVWVRRYSTNRGRAPDCATLETTLEALGAERMVVGHTVQREAGVNSACGGKVWRIDVGMSSHYGGEPAALEIHDDRNLSIIEVGSE